MNAVTGNLRVLLRVEGLFVLMASAYAYYLQDYSWQTFAVLFLVPDIAFAGYLFGSRIGSISYNCTHSYIGPISLIILGQIIKSDILLMISIIWFAHIGFDRALGYGLKYADGFAYTHLGRIGNIDVNS